MQFSAFKGPFEERIEQWNHKLFIIGEVLDKWLEVQRNWMYLQPIFESPDINKQLPAEGKKFATVNKNWCATVTAAKARPVPTQCFSRNFSELEVRVDGVGATPRRRDAIEAAVRASTRRVSEPRRFRDSFARRSSWSFATTRSCSRN